MHSHCVTSTNDSIFMSKQTKATLARSRQPHPNIKYTNTKGCDNCSIHCFVEKFNFPNHYYMKQYLNYENIQSTWGLSMFTTNLNRKHKNVSNCIFHCNNNKITEIVVVKKHKFSINTMENMYKTCFFRI